MYSTPPLNRARLTHTPLRLKIAFSKPLSEIEVPCVSYGPTCVYRFWLREKDSNLQTPRSKRGVFPVTPSRSDLKRIGAPGLEPGPCGNLPLIQGISLLFYRLNYAPSWETLVGTVELNLLPSCMSRRGALSRLSYVPAEGSWSRWMESNHHRSLIERLLLPLSYTAFSLVDPAGLKPAPYGLKVRRSVARAPGQQRRLAESDLNRHSSD